ncbi:MAG: hypothetical protein M1828_005703 [Chrysothrix sp. TS-e1954]|nr:MAG: hypothetical protein M1828_005703 [Chrysothrix sp. TS-e1954]
MSSPPATSPTYPSSISLPRKRPSPASSSHGSGQPNVKRRKPSTTSNASHPLRQTSFPPGDPNARLHAPTSRRSSFSPAANDAGSVSSFGRESKKGRGRKARSTTGTARQTKNARSGEGSLVGGEGSRAEREEDEPEEDEADGANDTILEEGGKMDEAALKQEREHLAMLMEAFDEEQTHRHDTWRRVRLKKETVRKITNQTLSQSVPASIVTTINGYTKLFIGELLERALDVQTEWLAAAPQLPTGEVKVPADDGSTIKVEEMDRGPLLPDHLREAWRRYKKDRDGGGAGYQGLSLQGKEGVAARAGGKRLFR